MAFTGHAMSLSQEQLCECTFVVGRQKRWTRSAHDVLYVGYSLLTCVLGRKGRE